MDSSTDVRSSALQTRFNFYFFLNKKWDSFSNAARRRRQNYFFLNQTTKIMTRLTYFFQSNCDVSFVVFFLFCVFVGSRAAVAFFFLAQLFLTLADLLSFSFDLLLLFVFFLFFFFFFS